MTSPNALRSRQGWRHLHVAVADNVVDYDYDYDHAYDHDRVDHALARAAYGSRVPNWA